MFKTWTSVRTLRSAELRSATNLGEIFELIFTVEKTENRPIPEKLYVVYFGNSSSEFVPSTITTDRCLRNIFYRIGNGNGAAADKGSTMGYHPPPPRVYFSYLIVSVFSIARIRRRIQSEICEKVDDRFFFFFGLLVFLLSSNWKLWISIDNFGGKNGHNFCYAPPRKISPARPWLAKEKLERRDM